MKYKHIPIKIVSTGSIAWEAGLQEGDLILSINKEKISDIFDYRFLIADHYILLEVQKPDGDIWEIEIEKDTYEDLGIEFDNPMLDEAQSCTNKCIFCFIDQLPGGMRQTLYFKDDDSRLSFFMGNYVTLTNMDWQEIDRIIKYKMSPINVSVHTTNPELRVSMLNNRFAGDVMDKIKRLIDGNITINAQIVLCRGINDGKELDKSIENLSIFYPGLKSISVVPVGITRFRDGLTKLEPYDGLNSQKVIRQIELWQERLLTRYGSRIVFLADEFYTRAGEEIPEYHVYEDFEQLENGVGLIATLRHEFYKHIDKVRGIEKVEREISIPTGVSSYKYIKEMALELEKSIDALQVRVYRIENEFFGKNVTVTGLITGQDLSKQLKGKDLGQELLIPMCMLKADEKIFLDDYSVAMLEEELGTKITIVKNCGKDFIEKILGFTL